jgi:hypothetical protein
MRVFKPGDDRKALVFGRCNGCHLVELFQREDVRRFFSGAAGLMLQQILVDKTASTRARLFDVFENSAEYIS